jgi:hypothetical protein
MFNQSNMDGGSWYSLESLNVCFIFFLASKPLGLWALRIRNSGIVWKWATSKSNQIYCLIILFPLKDDHLMVYRYTQFSDRPRCFGGYSDQSIAQGAHLLGKEETISQYPKDPKGSKIFAFRLANPCVVNCINHLYHVHPSFRRFFGFQPALNCDANFIDPRKKPGFEALT